MASSLFGLVRESADAREDSPTLVLLHGLGSNEEDLMSLAPELDEDLRVVAFRAPFTYGPQGYAWFSIDWNAEGIRIDVDQAKRSRDILIEELKGLRTGGPLILGGFSQGAIMSLAAGVIRPDLVDGLMLLSGRDIPDLYDDVVEGFAGMPCLIQHGVYDQVLPVQGARRMRESLTGFGATVEYHEYPMAHEISPESLHDAISWLAGRT